VKRGANVTARTRTASRRSWFAAWRGHVDAVRWLLDRGAQITAPACSGRPCTTRWFAGHEKASKALIARAPTINGALDQRVDPVDDGGARGPEDLAMLLVDLGADTT